MRRILAIAAFAAASAIAADPAPAPAATGPEAQVNQRIQAAIAKGRETQAQDLIDLQRAFNQLAQELKDAQAAAAKCAPAAEDKKAK